MNRPPTHRRLVLALTLLTLAGAPVATASAAPPATASSVAAPHVVRVTPPHGRTGTLVVTALRNGATETVRVAGVVFTATPVTSVDLTTSAGWDEAARFTRPGAVPEHTLGAPLTLSATSADGVATLEDVPIGLYLLRAPGWADIFVTVPIANASAPDGWQRTVVVFPKHEPTPTDPPPTEPPTGTPTTEPPTETPTDDGTVEPPAETPAAPPGETPVETPTDDGTVDPPAEPPVQSPTDDGTVDEVSPADPGPDEGQVLAPPPGDGGGTGGTGGSAGTTSDGSGGWLGGDGVTQAVQRGLAYTGAELAGPLGAALAALLAGAGLVVLARRRRTEDHRA